MLLCELQDLTPDQLNALRKQLVKNIKSFCQKTFDKPVELTAKGDHVFTRHHTNDQIEFDIWLHEDYIYLDNFYLDESMKNLGIGTGFVECVVASLPDHLTVKVKDHTRVDDGKASLSNTFWNKMKARHDDRKWIIVR
jgi:hypothetical protein